MSILSFLVLSQVCEQSNAFVHPFGVQTGRNPVGRSKYRTHVDSRLHNAASPFYNDFDDDEDEDDEDDLIDPDSLGDWRNFRRNLAQAMHEEEDAEEPASVRTSVSTENEEVLQSQSRELAEEYKNGVWAHEVSTVSGTNHLSVSRTVAKESLDSRLFLYCPGTTI